MSLRARILTGFAVVMVLVIGLGIAVVANQRSQLLEQLDRQLEAIIPLERPAPPDAGIDRPPVDIDRPVEEPISDVFIAAVRPDGTVDVLVQGQLLDAVPDVSTFAGAPLDGRTFSTVDSTDGSTRFRVLADPVPGAAFTTVIALPTTEIDETVRNLAVAFVVVALLVAAVLALVAWWIVRLGLRPISAMTETARSISRGDRSERAPEIDERTEAGQLATAFNVMLDQRDEAEDTLRRFASDASHELRTPLTSIRGYLDLYTAGAFRVPDQLDDAVRRMRDEAQRMNDLVEQLLQLARLDEAGELHRTPVDLGHLIRDVVANARAGHAGRNIVVDAPADGAVVVPVDHGRMTQLLTVLVDNALTHAPDATVDVNARSAPERLVIVVADDGPGLDQDDAAHVFGRFYRPVSSRSRTNGGSGLGLAIAQTIAEAHGGNITLRTAPGEGCEFTVEIPLLDPDG